MTFIRFFNPEVPGYRDENENEAYERLVHRFNTGYGCQQGAVPPSNISEGDKEYSIEMALPGVDKKDIHVEHDKGNLTIRIEKNGENKEGESYTRREFDYSGASRTFKTGEKIDTENITARFENGILTVNLPKKEVFAASPHSITIE